MVNLLKLLYSEQEYEEIINILNPNRCSKEFIPYKLTYIYLWSLYRLFLKRRSILNLNAESEFEFIASEMIRLEPDDPRFKDIIATNRAYYQYRKSKKKNYYHDYDYSVDLEEEYYFEKDYDDQTAIEQGNL